MYIYYFIKAAEKAIPKLHVCNMQNSPLTLQMQSNNKALPLSCSARYLMTKLSVLRLYPKQLSNFIIVN